MGEPLITIIISCKNEGENIRRTLNSIMENSGPTPYQVIVVDDGSNDGCCDFLKTKKVNGVVLITTPGVYANQARNIGAAKAEGSILVFCDAHIFVEKDWLEKLAGSLQLPGIDAVSPGIKPHDYEGPAWGGLTWEPDMTTRWLFCSENHAPVPVLPRNCLAVTREAFYAVGGFENGFRVYGYEDMEFTIKLWLFGFGAYITPEVTVRHLFQRTRSYPISKADVEYNLLRLAFLHLNQDRLSRVIELKKNSPYFPGIFTDVILGDVLERRKEYLSCRKYDDDWFVQKFNIPL